MEELTDAEIRQQLDLNLPGPINLTQTDQPPLRTALGVDTFATLQKAYADSLQTLEAQKELAQPVAIQGKAGFRPGA